MRYLGNSYAQFICIAAYAGSLVRELEGRLAGRLPRRDHQKFTNIKTVDATEFLE